MTDEELKQWETKPTHELFNFVIEKDSSERKHVAMYVLERRKNRLLERAAIASAFAAGLSLVATAVSVYLSLTMK